MFAVAAALLAAWLIPAVLARRRGPQLAVAASQTVHVDCPPGPCSSWICDARNLPRYEEKVQRCTVFEVEGQIRYTCTGRFCGLPWRGTFSLHPTPDGGFHSVMVEGPHRGNASGGFRLSPVPEGTRITHYERYVLSVWLPYAALLQPWIQRWLEATMATEMCTIQSLLEAQDPRRSRDPSRQRVMSRS